MIIGCRGWSNGIDTLLDHRIYRPETVDAVLQDSAIALTDESFRRLSSPPDTAAYQFESLRRRRMLLTALAERLVLDQAPRERLGAIARFTAGIERLFPSPEHAGAGGYYPTPDDFWWGGTEEQVIAKGSDWCNEIARVYCGLAQVSGIPARIVYTLSQDDGHVIAECFVDGRWTLVDPLAPKVYTRADGSPLSAVAMATASIEQRARHTSGHEGPYVHQDFFAFIAIAEYRLIDAEHYDYSPSRCNAFYRRLLTPMWNK